MAPAGINGIGIAICVAVCVTLLFFGVNPFAIILIASAWLATLWLAPAQVDTLIADGMQDQVPNVGLAELLEDLTTPVIVISGDRVASANCAARDLLGAHVAGENARVALRHPQAVALLGGDQSGSVTFNGLSSSTAIWKMTSHILTDGRRLIEFQDQTAQSDLARAHTDFVANASHELRTPLSALLGYIETLTDAKAGGNPATRDRFLEIMRREAARMQGLIQDLMSLSRIEAEKHDLPQTQVDLSYIVNSVIKESKTASDQKARLVYDEMLPTAPVMGDAGQLAQMVRNLVDNAIKYGGKESEVTVRLVKDGSKTVMLSVIDRGDGIAPEHLPHLTRRFYRADPGRSRAAGGTGLGLAIVKHIVERHRGQLDITSIQREGTKVHVRLPLG
jgi:two-component system, OmpR family, phosphate regulon sensor histidine kinase PhoR